MSKRGAGEGHSGGGGHDAAGMMRWLLTYADMITLLMVFFIVLFSMSRVDLKKFQGLSKALRTSLVTGGSGLLTGQGVSLGQADASAGDTGQGSTPEGLELWGEDLAGVLSEDNQSGDIKVYSSERGIVISMQGSVLYASGSADIESGAEPLLHDLAQALGKLKNYIAVEGYTDDVPINTPMFPSNWELSTRRATNVVRYLIEREGLKPERFVAVGYGEYRPQKPNTSEANRARNRRVDVVVLRSTPVYNLGRELKPVR